MSEYCTACNNKGFLEVLVDAHYGSEFYEETWENQWCQDCNLVVPDNDPPTIKEEIDDLFDRSGWPPEKRSN